MHVHDLKLLNMLTLKNVVVEGGQALVQVQQQAACRFGLCTSNACFWCLVARLQECCSTFHICIIMPYFANVPILFTCAMFCSRNACLDFTFAKLCWTSTCWQSHGIHCSSIRSPLSFPAAMLSTTMHACCVYT